ncbi:MAG: hypothetical protein ACI8XW_003339 [Gammaproteobacteria bacterium]|jgi:hypothetical protein
MISAFPTHFLHPLFNKDNNTENNSLTSTISCPVYGVHFCCPVHILLALNSNIGCYLGENTPLPIDWLSLTSYIGY